MYCFISIQSIRTCAVRATTGACHGPHCSFGSRKHSFSIKVYLSYDCQDVDITSLFQDCPMHRPVPYLPTRSHVIGNCWSNLPSPANNMGKQSSKSDCISFVGLYRVFPGTYLVMGRRQKWSSMELARYAEVLALFQHTYFCIDAGGWAWRRCFGTPPSCRSALLAENSCSFEAACTFSWPHFVLRASWYRRGISCITVTLPPCVFLWFHLYSLHYRGPSVWLGPTHSLTCQITSA